MKPLQPEELFQHLSGFLKTKGITLTEGSYAQAIQKSCGLLSDAINLGQDNLGRAKARIDRKLEQMRQVIHEKTAPRTERNTQRPETKSPQPEPPPPPAAETGAGAGKRRPRSKTAGGKTRVKRPGRQSE